MIEYIGKLCLSVLSNDDYDITDLFGLIVECSSALGTAVIPLIVVAMATISTLFS